MFKISSTLAVSARFARQTSFLIHKTVLHAAGRTFLVGGRLRSIRNVPLQDSSEDPREALHVAVLVLLQLLADVVDGHTVSDCQ
jgi:hypothetical protein